MLKQIRRRASSKKGSSDVPRSKSGAFNDSALETFEREPSTPIAFKNFEAPKPYIQEEESQADLEAMRALEIERQEDLERQRLIEQLAQERVGQASATPTVTAQVNSPPAYPDKRQADPALRFIRELPSKPHHRREVASFLKGQDNGSLSPRESIVAHITDAGYAVPDLASLVKAAQIAKCEELLTWASRYNLFVLWSADRQHPWDSLETADLIAATLEIGKGQESNEAIVLLDGVNIPQWTFVNGRFNTTQPITWKAPSGEEVQVQLELNFNVFSGYGGSSKGLNYFAPQCQGVLWPATQETPLDWPISPPLIVGKVAMTSRPSALSPGTADQLREYCGTYNTHFLTVDQDKHAVAGPELHIDYSDDTDGMVVALDGVPIREYTLSANNVISWQDQVHGSGTVFLQKLQGGPVLFGDIKTGSFINNLDSGAGYTVFAELKKDPSRLTATGNMNSGLAGKIAAGLQTMAALLVGDVLALSQRLDSAFTSPNARELLQQKLAHLEVTEQLAETFAESYLKSDPHDGTLDYTSVIRPDLVQQVYEAFAEAKRESEVAEAKAVAARKDCQATREAEAQLNVASATYHAAQTSLRAQEAAKACAAAEKLADKAGRLAQEANTAVALDSAITAAQAFNLAHASCLAAAKEQAAAAASALHCVSAGINSFVQQRDFEKLRDVAQASNIATKVLAMATDAVNDWEQNTVISRLSALQSANRAAADAQECNKITRRMNPVTAGGQANGLMTGYSNELSSNQSFDPSVLGLRTPPRSENGQRPNLFESPVTPPEPLAYE